MRKNPISNIEGILGTKGLEEITLLYTKLIADAVTKEAMRTFNIIRFSGTDGAIVNTWGSRSFMRAPR
jgi:hypothetical protein